MHNCEADFRHDDSEKESFVSNGSISAVFDVKNNGYKMEESAQQLTRK